MELEEAFDKKKLMVLGLAEVRRINEKMIELKSGHMLMHSNCLNGQRGLVF